MTYSNRTVSIWIVVAALFATTILGGCSHNNAGQGAALVPPAAPGQKPTAWNPNNPGMMAKKAQWQQMMQLAEQQRKK